MTIGNSPMRIFPLMAILRARQAALNRILVLPFFPPHYRRVELELVLIVPQRWDNSRGLNAALRVVASSSAMILY